MKKWPTIIILLLSLSNGVYARDPSTPKFSILNAITPDEVIVQYAGNIGFLSAGIGYEFIQDRLTSNFIIGYVPEEIANTSITTLSFKNTFHFMNFKPQLINRFYPSAGFSVNMETGNNSFLILPDRYPNDYYETNAFTFLLFCGLNYQGKIHDNSVIRQIEYYAETGTLANYLYYAYQQRDYFNSELWSLAIGLKLRLN